MLKNIPPILSPELLKVLAEMGHGDLIVIADHFYPSFSCPPGGKVVQAKGNSAAVMVDAILDLMPLDTEYCEYPVEYMVPDADAGVVMERSKVWDDVTASVVNHGFQKECVGEIERTKFYEKARGAYVTVCTSEQLPYGCIIMQKGVL